MSRAYHQQSSHVDCCFRSVVASATASSFGGKIASSGFRC